ncbi:MAG: MBL fold metallo-hydrolase [Halopseudomonas sp.]
MKIKFPLITASMLSLSLAGSPLLAADDVKITVQPVGEGISMIMGKGGNIGLFTGEDGTFLIDDQFAPLTEKILQTIKEAGGATPKYLLNTHFHGDHTGGNENLGNGGTLIFSHDNVRERLARPSVIAAFNMRSPAKPKAALPVVTFSDNLTLHINGETVRAIHVADAHTDGDSFIHFEKANVIHAGDIFFNGFYPFIDADHGGTLKGVISAIDQILDLADDSTRIIPGHGPIGDQAALASYRAMLQTAYDRLRALKDDGKSTEEAVAAKPLSDLEEKWGQGIFSGDKWIQVIYAAVR